MLIKRSLIQKTWLFPPSFFSSTVKVIIICKLCCEFFRMLIGSCIAGEFCFHRFLYPLGHRGSGLTIFPVTFLLILMQFL